MIDKDYNSERLWNRLPAVRGEWNDGVSDGQIILRDVKTGKIQVQMKKLKRNAYKTTCE